jgi:hypothetical protein
MNLKEKVYGFKTQSEWGFTIPEILDLANELEKELTQEVIEEKLGGLSFSNINEQETFTYSDVYSLLKNL